VYYTRLEWTGLDWTGLHSWCLSMGLIPFFTLQVKARNIFCICILWK
jgi:hypothetical protein